MKKLILRASTVAGIMALGAIAATTVVNAATLPTSLLKPTTVNDPFYSAGFMAFFFGFICCVIIVSFLIHLLISYVVYKDAQKNNIDNPFLWAVVVYFFNLFGILIYILTVRNDAMKLKNAQTPAIADPKKTEIDTVN